MSSIHEELSRHDEPADLPDDPGLLAAVQEFLRELEAGRRPDRDEFLGRYPDLAGPLAQCLDGLNLVHQVASGTRSHAPSLAPIEGAPHEGTPPSALGDFQIIREIGRGGMGIVYEAMQLSLGRRVALKALPFAATLDPKHLQRFHNEAHAAAQLHHTNIVPVYAVGCERGVHFYAMQLIDGQSLATVIEEMRVRKRLAEIEGAASDAVALTGTQVDERSASPGRPRQAAANVRTVSEFSTALSTQRTSKPRDFFRAAASLMVQAAGALEHAHQFGIVHRDIKPANLLADVHGRLWITDFGLAQFHADAGLTQTGDLIGTLRYMSPEQASGQRVLLDHRTDIYSLGATLYQLVTLEPIFPGENRQELLHQIAHDEPRPPRMLAPQTPVELETIILKAVNKHPADRYASAQEFADDLQRFLENKPILAKRPTLIDRARKWSRRHPSVVAAGLLLLVVGIVGLSLSNWMISQERNKTTAALGREKQRAAEARRALDLLVEVSEEELADHPQLQDVRKRLLQTALNYYQDLLGTQEGSQADLEAGQNRVRNILDELATLQGAHLLNLATDKSVQADLKISEQQQTQLAQLAQVNKRSWEQFREQLGLAPEARRQLRDELAKQQEAALNDILETHQLGRLRQIELQKQGSRAFREGQAVASLKITSEQRRQIRDVKEKTMAKMFAALREKGPSGEPRKPPPFEEVMKTELEGILAILTPDQKQRWLEMTGAAFEGSVRQGPPGGFRPKGPPAPK